MEFKDARVIVTGAGRGIGFELTRQLLSHGANVVATLRGEPTKELAQLKEQNPERLQILPLDVSKDGSAMAFGAKVMSIGWDHVDLLINNAGVIGDRVQGLEKVDTETVLKTFDTNTLGPLRVTRAVLPLLLKSKNPAVAQISSLMGSIQDNGSGAYYAYRMSKAALNMFNKSLSKDYPQLTCLTLHPGWVQTDMGGAGATVTPQDCAAGLLKVITSADTSKSGRFYDYKAKELPW